MNAELIPPSILRRLAAYAVDVGVAAAGAVALQAVLYPINPLLKGATSPSGAALHAWVTLTVTLPVVVFFGLSWGSRSAATPGMRLLHIRVRSTDGGRVSRGRAMLRGLVLLLPFEVNHAVLFHPQPIWAMPAPEFRTGFLVVYLLLLIYLVVTWWTPARQGPHDLVAGTVVTERRGTT